ncbi:hypothetical protein NDU88_004354 [Pleurodeles waltl]|uniref:MsrB domain-containing protein n=1 Tax=Pleurodeles waltl TaxID=8319 RepID=A0AAV7SII5_PLEWA|nr:hypothetical protein NDU88_004354 [Pleurodeles waltl]
MNAADASHHSCEAPARRTASLRVSQAVTSAGVCYPQVPKDDVPKRDGAHTPAVITDTLTGGGARVCNRPCGLGVQYAAGEASPLFPVPLPLSEGQNSAGRSWGSRACGDLPEKFVDHLETGGFTGREQSCELYCRSDRHLGHALRAP